MLPRNRTFLYNRHITEPVKPKPTEKNSQWPFGTGPHPSVGRYFCEKNNSGNHVEFYTKCNVIAKWRF